MKDLRSAKLIYLKAVLFVVLGSMAAALIIVRNPEVTTALLLAISIWAFCRAYYFAFYVIEHYVDSSFRYSGLLSFLRSMSRLIVPSNSSSAYGFSRNAVREPPVSASTSMSDALPVEKITGSEAVAVMRS